MVPGTSLISFASVVTYEQVVTCDNLNNQIVKLLMFLVQD